MTLEQIRIPIKRLVSTPVMRGIVLRFILYLFLLSLLVTMPLMITTESN